MDKGERQDTSEDTAPLVYSFFKAFTAPARLRLAARLLNGPATLTELAAELQMAAAAVVRHLGLLEEMGLVVMVGDGKMRAYRFSEERLRALAASVLETPQPQRPTDERTKTLATFFQNGRLVRIPAQVKRQLYVLAAVAAHFQPGQTYREREVNAILTEVYPDGYVTLRRLLVDFGFLKRDNAVGGAVYTKGLVPEAVLAAHGVGSA